MGRDRCGECDDKDKGQIEKANPKPISIHLNHLKSAPVNVTQIHTYRIIIHNLIVLTFDIKLDCNSLRF